MLEVFGAEIILTPGAEGSNGAVQRANALAAEHPEWCFLYQYGNDANPRAHYEGTGPEIWQDCPEITHFVAGLGTSGTLMGTGRFLKEQNPDIKIDRHRAAARRARRGPAQPRRGLHPAGVRATGTASTCSTASASCGPRESIEWTRRLVDESACSPGSRPARRWPARPRSPPRSSAGTIVFIVCDGGWKYLSTGAYTDDLDAAEAERRAGHLLLTSAGSRTPSCDDGPMSDRGPYGQDPEPTEVFPPLPPDSSPTPGGPPADRQRARPRADDRDAAGPTAAADAERDPDDGDALDRWARTILDRRTAARAAAAAAAVTSRPFEPGTRPVVPPAGTARRADRRRRRADRRGHRPASSGRATTATTPAPTAAVDRRRPPARRRPCRRRPRRPRRPRCRRRRPRRRPPPPRRRPSPRRRPRRRPAPPCHRRRPRAADHDRGADHDDDPGHHDDGAGRDDPSGAPVWDGINGSPDLSAFRDALVCTQLDQVIKQAATLHGAGPDQPGDGRPAGRRPVQRPRHDQADPGAAHRRPPTTSRPSRSSGCRH